MGVCLEGAAPAFGLVIDFEDSHLTLSDRLNYLNYKQWACPTEWAGDTTDTATVGAVLPWELHMLEMFLFYLM